MDFLVVFLLMALLITTECEKSPKVKRRLHFLENQVNKLESRVSSETSKLQVELYEVSSTVLDLNSSLYQHEADCRNDNKQTSISQQSETKDIEASFQETNQRLMAAFSDEKSKIREAFDRIDQHLEEISQNNTKQSTLELQKVGSEYNELKKIIQTLNTTIGELQEDLSNQIEISVKEIQTNIIEELRQLVDAQIKDLKTAMENKTDQLRYINQIQDSTTTLVNTYECPTLWSKYGQFCYRYFNDGVVYSEAKRVCADNGASVVDLQSQAEADFVQGLVGSYHWIGLTDIEEEGVYKWDRTDSEASFVNWYPGEPESDSVNESLDCVSAFPSGNWFTHNCRRLFNFVCKKTL